MSFPAFVGRLVSSTQPPDSGGVTRSIRIGPVSRLAKVQYSHQTCRVELVSKSFNTVLLYSGCSNKRLPREIWSWRSVWLALGTSSQAFDTTYVMAHETLAFSRDNEAAARSVATTLRSAKDQGLISTGFCFNTGSSGINSDSY